MDVRLNNVSQLAGFTKRDDLRYFTKAICNIDYIHLPDLAPTERHARRLQKTQGRVEDHTRNNFWTSCDLGGWKIKSLPKC